MYQLEKINNDFCNEKKIIVFGYETTLIPKQNIFFLSPIPILNAQQMNYEVGTEEGVLALFLAYLTKKSNNPFSYDWDLGYLSAESNLDEEEMQELLDFIGEEKPLLIFTSDFIKHPNFGNLFALIETLSSYAKCIFASTSLHSDFLLPEYNGLVVRLCKGENKLIASQQFASIAKIENGDKIYIKNHLFENSSFFELNPAMRGTIAILQMEHLPNFYPYQKVTIIKTGK